MSQPTTRPGTPPRAPQDRVYLDHAATTPMHPEAITVMAEQLARVGNPSSLHASGRAARRVVEESREAIARAVNARPGEVVFTSGGTESDNLAVKGLYWSRRAEDPRRTRILSTAVEHHAVLDTLQWLEEEGAEVELLPVNRCGRLELDALRESIGRDPGSVALVSVMWANNEVGTVQPVREVVEIAHAHGVPVHTDAVQAVGKVPVAFRDREVSLMTVAAHKLQTLTSGLKRRAAPLAASQKEAKCPSSRPRAVPKSASRSPEPAKSPAPPPANATA